MDITHTFEMIGFLTNLRGSQLILVAIIIFLLFGTKRLPDMARGFGKAIREFRKSASEAEQNLQEAMTDKAPPTVANSNTAAPSSEVKEQTNKAA